jgi:hypothetical protein
MKAVPSILFALIASAAVSTAFAGAVGGPRVNSQGGFVSGRSTDAYSIAFHEGEIARIVISGDGDSDLDLIVKDRFGNVVCRAEGSTDDEVCRFVPDETARYRVEVRNLGRMPNAYSFRTN